MVAKLICVGRLVRDPETRTSQNGTFFAIYTLACDSFSNAEKEKETIFIDCIASNSNGVFAQRFFKKGDLVYVEGCLRDNSYKKKDGSICKSIQLVVNCSHLLRSNNSNSTDKSEVESIQFNDEDLPF